MNFVCDRCRDGDHCSGNEAWCDCQHRKRWTTARALTVAQAAGMWFLVIFMMVGTTMPMARIALTPSPGRSAFQGVILMVNLFGLAAMLNGSHGIRYGWR